MVAHESLPNINYKRDKMVFVSNIYMTYILQIGLLKLIVIHSWAVLI